MTQRRVTLGLRISLWICTGIGALFFIVTLFFLFLPDSSIRDQIEIQSKAMGWPIRCEDFHYKPFGSFEFRGVEVAFQPDSVTLPIPFLQIHRLQIRARIWSLLFRRISVASIEIENPRFSFTSDFSQKIRPVSPQKPAEKAKAPLFVFSIDTLALQNFTLRMAFPPGNGFQALEWKGLRLSVSQFSLSKKKTWPDLTGKISLLTDHSHLSIDSKWGRKEWTPELVLDFLSQHQGKWKMDFETRLFSSNGEKKLMALRLNAHGEKALGQGIVDSAEFFLGGQRVLGASGRFSWIVPEIGFEIQSAPVALARLKPVLAEIFPDSLFNSIQLGGKITLCSGKIFWRKDRFWIQCHSQWKEVMVKGFSPFQTKGFEGRMDVLRDSSENPIRVTGEALFPSILLTTLPEIKNTRLAWALDLENGFSSHLGSVSASIGEIWDGQGQIQASWKARDFTQTKNLTGQAVIDISGIELANFSDTEKGISGKVHGRADLRIQQGRNAQCEISFSLPKIIFSSGEKQDSLPPLDFHALVQAIARENFQKWVVEDSKLWIGKGFSGIIKGEISPQKNQWHFVLKKGVFDNPFLVSYLPFSFLETFEGIKAFGKETLEIDFSQSPKGMEIQGNFTIENTGLELPLQGVQMQDIQGQLEFHGNEKQFTGNGKMVFGSVLIPQIRPDPLVKNQWEFAWAWTFPDRFEILQSRIALPSVALQGELEGKADQFSTTPILWGKMALRFSSLNMLSMTPWVSLCGDFETKAEVRTVDSEKGHFQIKGHAFLDSLDVNMLPFLEIQNIFGKVPFSFFLDPIQKKWISPAVSRKYPLRTYPIQKSWFASFSPTLSTLEIKKIKWKGYTVDSIQIDTDFSEARFEIPRFRLGFLGGNAGGRVCLEMREGRPLWDIQGDFGQINSATLVRGLKPGEETELNATLHFQGQGINPQADFDINGALHIMQIGPAFTSTLLEALDPKGRDRNVRLTRRLLSMGSKPKRFSFEIQHGYVYPSLELDQPWYSPLPIPEKIQYGRLPLGFFLQFPSSRKP